MIEHYLGKINQIENWGQYSKVDLLIDDLLILKDGKVSIYYAPFDYLNKNAKVLLLGITPGFAQMQNAYKTIVPHINKEPLEACLQRVKKEASFSGPLRNNLVKMLDEIGLNDYLNIESCATCFGENNDLVHNTSILRYPVFYNQTNYSGSQPPLLKNSHFLKMIHETFLSELSQLDPSIVIVPMGKAINEAVEYLRMEGHIKNQIILSNFPHPSGANGNRKRQFEENKSQLTHIIQAIK